MPSISSDIQNLQLASQGQLRIDWAAQQMPVLDLIKHRFAKEKPLKGYTLGACLHVTSETANLMLALKAAGAHIALCASNPLSTQDDIAAALVKNHQISVFAVKGENHQTYYQHLNQVLDFHPQLTMDDGADLVSEVHKNRTQQLSQIVGSSEETTTGVIRLKAMAKAHALKIPVIAVNDSDTKHFFDNHYGTGQSTIDGILRATNILLAGKTFVVGGYGWCGRGIANRARGMGAHVIVTEVDPVKALQASLDGFTIMPMLTAAKVGDIFVSATGDKHVIPLKAILRMKDGAIIAQSGHFDIEIDVAGLRKIAKKVRHIRPSLDEYTLPLKANSYQPTANKRVYLLGEGRLVNLAAAEGHPAEVMDMSFANQALAAEYLVKNQGKLKKQVYRLPHQLDRRVAKLKLKALGIKIDHLTRDQRHYLTSWTEGT